MDSFTIELVSNASEELFPDKTLSFFANFLSEQVNVQGQWELTISDLSYPSVYQNKTMGKINFFEEKLSKAKTTYNLEPGIYTSITDVVEAMNTLIQEKNNHNKTCKTVRVSRRTQKVVIMLANDDSAVAFCSTDLGHIFGNNLGNKFGVLIMEKGPHEPEFAYNIVHIQSLMIYSDLVEYNNLQYKSSLATMLSLYLKAKGEGGGGDIITTGQYMNYQTFSTLQFRPVLESFIHSIHIDLR